MQHPPNSPNLYPFGKLYPIIPQISKFLAIKIRQAASSWHDAANCDDLDSMLAITALINHIKESQHYYQVSQNEEQVFLNMRTNLFISHTMAKLIKNGNSHNRKVAMILIQILSFYYMKFKVIQEVFSFMEYLSQTIDAVQKLLLMKGNQCENFQIFKYTPEYKYVKEAFVEFTVMVTTYEKNKKSSLALSIVQEISQQTDGMLQHICENKILDIFHSTLIYLRLDFLKFLEVAYQEQIAELTKLEKKKKRSSEGLLFLIEKGSFQSMSLLYRQSSKSLSSQKLLFSYLKPLLSFIPDALMSGKSLQGKQLILQNYFKKTLGLLNKLLNEEERWYEQQHSTIRINTQRDFIRAFTDSSILNDIEVALVGFEEEEILEHKGVVDYKEEYEQILEYFKSVIDVKNKLIQSIETLYHRFTEEWTGAEILMRQIDNLLPQSQSKGFQQQSNKAKKSLQGSLSIYGNHKKINKKRKKPSNMDQILQSNEEDDETVYQRNRSKQRKYDQDSFSRQTDDDENASVIEIDMRPLQNMRDKNQSSQKSAQKKVQSEINGEGSKVYGVIPRGKQSKSSQGSSQSSQSSGAPRMMYIKSFVTYYQHHTHPYQSMAIFRQPKSLYLQKQDKLSQILAGSQEVVYPNIINKSLYETQEYSSVESKKIHINTKYLQKDLPKLSERLTIKRLQFIEKKNSMRKSGKNSKSQYQKLKNQHKEIESQVLKQVFGIRRQSISNGKIIIRLFPLNDTQVGKKMHLSLTQCLQMWMKLIDLKRKKKHGIMLGEQKQIIRSRKQFENPFNYKLFQLQNPYQLVIQALKDYQVMDYLFSLIYDLLAVLSGSKDENQVSTQLKQFNEIFFSNLDISHRCILLYYIYEIYAYEHLEFTDLVQNFVTNILSKKSITEILQFLIIQLKLQQAQFNLIYSNLYNTLSENCLATIYHIVDTLMYDVTPLVKDMDKKKDSNSSSQIRDRLNNRNPYQDIQKLKRNISEQFPLLIDMLNIWTIVTFGVSRPEYQLSNSETIKTFQGVLLFYCPYCSSQTFLIISPSKPYNYQELFCSNCSNSLMHRFEIEDVDEEFMDIRDKMKCKMKMMLIQCFEKLQKAMKDNEWKITELKYRKYEEKEREKINRVQKESLHRTQTLSPQRKSNKSCLKQSHKQHSTQKKGLQLSDYFESLESQSFTQRIGRLQNERSHPQKDQVRMNNFIGGQRSNAAMSSDNKPRNKYLSDNKEVFNTQRKENHSIPTNRNKPNANMQKQQRNIQKQKLQQNHEYCYNMQRLLNSYFNYVFSICSN